MSAKMKPGYKQTEVGVIPEDWDAKTLGSILTRGRLGGNYPNRDVESSKPLMKMGNIARGHFDLSKVEYVPENLGIEPEYRLCAGDVLFNTRNTLDLVGKVAIWRDELPEAYYNSNLMRLEFNPKVISSSVYANYALNGKPCIDRLRAMATGTTSVAAIYTRDLMQFLIAVPSNPEQRAIAAALSDVDGLLAKLDQLIVKKRDLKQAAMQQLLTGETRLPGFSGEWEMKSIGELCDYQNGTSLERFFNQEDGLKVISIGNYSVTGKYVDNGVYISNKHRKLVEKFILRQNDLTMSLNDKTSVGAIIGRVLLIDQDDLFVFNQRTMRLRPKETVSPSYLHHTINSDRSHSALVGLAKPGTQIYINTDDVIDLKLSVPPLPEQTAIAAILSDMDAEIAALEARRDKTRTLKQGMMQELLTGRIRLVPPINPEN